MGKRIIDETPLGQIEAELTPERFLRRTNKGGNEIYTFSASEAPALMREVGRLRELSFRSAGGGTGLECDIDRFDLMDPPCRQLVVWDPEHKIILGGYRYILGEDIRIGNDGQPDIATAHMFDFSRRFVADYLPATLELGRSFVRVGYQSSHQAAKSIYALDNLWDGLGALTVVYPQIKYLFGKVTMYPTYIRGCRNMILYFLHKHFPDPDRLVRPRTPLAADIDIDAMRRLFCGTTFKEDYKILNRAVREQGANIPPLVNAYMSLSPSMRMFGTAVNDQFGNVEESGIFFVIDEIFEEKKLRHIGTYTSPGQKP